VLTEDIMGQKLIFLDIDGTLTEPGKIFRRIPH